MSKLRIALDSVGTGSVCSIYLMKYEMEVK